MSNDPTVPIATLRRVCGAEAGEIEALIRSRQIAVKAGKTPLVAGVRAYLDYIRAEARTSSLTAARDDAREARAAAIELDLAEDERTLIPDEEADLIVSNLCGAVLREYHSAPARITRDLPSRRTIEAALHEAQTALAATFTGGNFAASSTRKRKSP